MGQGIRDCSERLTNKRNLRCLLGLTVLDAASKVI